MSDTDDVYTERAHLVALLSTLFPAAKTPAVDISSPGWWLVYLYIGDQQMSWHFAPQDTHLIAHVPTVPATDWRVHWDGHTTPQKYARMRQYMGLPV